jgi:hypothetical protein
MTEPSQPESPDTVRLQQGTSHDLASRRVGVMSVYEDKPGVVVAQLAINDPATNQTQQIEVKAHDDVAIGAAHYRVVQIVAGSGGNRGWLSLAPVTP